MEGMLMSSVETPLDNAASVADVAWEGAYFFKVYHKMGIIMCQYTRIPGNSLGFFVKGIYYVFAVLPFGWKSSPYIYHSITEAVSMYCRS